MAVYTKITPDEFRDILSRYSIGEFESATGISEGVENTNYLLNTSQNRYIITIYEKRVNSDDLPFFMGLMEHLAAQNISCPLPVHDKNGNILQEIKGKKFAITSFLNGKSVRSIKNNHCHEVGVVMAKMHLAAGDFKIKRANTMSLESWKNTFFAMENKADTIKSGLTSEISDALEFIESKWSAMEGNLPSGVIHGDLFPDNVFFEGDKLSGVLDFYFACNDFFVHDIAIALNCWCFEHGTEFNVTKARKFLQGYNSVRPLLDIELEQLPILASGTALRFLLSRLYDRINQVEGAEVTIKNPLEYLAKLRFHMQVKSHLEYGL